MLSTYLKDVIGGYIRGYWVRSCIEAVSAAVFEVTWSNGPRFKSWCSISPDIRGVRDQLVHVGKGGGKAVPLCRGVHVAANHIPERKRRNRGSIGVSIVDCLKDSAVYKHLKKLNTWAGTYI